MFKRLLEFLTGLDAKFLDSPGELTRRFDPHWPGPLIGDAGKWPNYLLGIAALALFIILSRRTATRQLHNVRLALAAGSALLAAALIPAALGVHWWSIAIVAGVLVAIVSLYFSGREVGLMSLGRLALFGILLMVISGTLAWNSTLAIAGALLVIYVYRREGRSVVARIFLGTLRAALIAFVLLLLNNPIIGRLRTITEPSVVAVLIDDSLSMSVHDVNPGEAAAGDTRFQAGVKLFTDEDQALIKKLAKVHTLQFYTFDQNANPVGKVAGPDESAEKPETPPKPAALPAATGKKVSETLTAVVPEGPSTQVVPSILTVLNGLQGQRLAGVVVITDGRDTPTSPLSEAYKKLANYGVKVYSIGVGSEKQPKNISVQSVSIQDSAFKDDIVNLKTIVRATGYEPGHQIKLRLTDATTGLPLKRPEGGPVEKSITVPDSKPIEEELLFKPDQVGLLKIKVEAVRQPGELDEKDNEWLAEISVLEAKITVLYVEGYPRWEYRYIKNEMLRDKTVLLSCILTSADPTFIQEHTNLKDRGVDSQFKYFTSASFPTTMEQIMECDVILFGDVDPRQFSDSQLQLVSDFVSKKGGGFGMIAGPQWSPAKYHGTPIELLLPVAPVNTDSGWPTETITEGFRPVLTKDGSASSIFRFFTDKTLNERYIKNDLQPLFWYCRNIVAKPATQVLAEHPTDLGPDRRKAPLLVLGRFGAGRTLFSAYDDSWRWRFYTGESIFDTYWIQQLRHLARSKKLGQRQITFSPEKKVYQLGEQIKLDLTVLDPAILRQLSQKIDVHIKDEKTGQIIRTEKLQSSPGQPDTYTVSFGADKTGNYKLEIRDDVVNSVSRLEETMQIIIPRLELADATVDRSTLSQITSQTGGASLALEEARAKLPELIQSAARTLAPPDDHPLWDKPIALVIFVLLLTMEWVLRKVFGMV